MATGASSVASPSPGAPHFGANHEKRGSLAQRMPLSYTINTHVPRTNRRSTCYTVPMTSRTTRTALGVRCRSLLTLCLCVTHRGTFHSLWCRSTVNPRGDTGRDGERVTQTGNERSVVRGWADGMHMTRQPRGPCVRMEWRFAGAKNHIPAVLKRPRRGRVCSRCRSRTSLHLAKIPRPTPTPNCDIEILPEFFWKVAGGAKDARHLKLSDLGEIRSFFAEAGQLQKARVFYNTGGFPEGLG